MEAYLIFRVASVPVLQRKKIHVLFFGKIRGRFWIYNEKSLGLSVRQSNLCLMVEAKIVRQYQVLE